MLEEILIVSDPEILMSEDLSQSGLVMPMRKSKFALLKPITVQRLL